MAIKLSKIIWLLPVGLFLLYCFLPSPVQKAKEPDGRKGEVALFLIRAGYDRWAAACAHSLALDGKSLDETIARCTIDHSRSGLSHDEIVKQRLNGESIQLGPGDQEG